MNPTRLKIGEPLNPPFIPKVLEPIEYSKFFGSLTFNSKEWMETVNQITENLLQIYDSRKLQSNAHLFPLAGLIKSMFEYLDHCVVIDFGGGLGDNFLKISSNIPKENLKK